MSNNRNAPELLSVFVAYVIRLSLAIANVMWQVLSGAQTVSLSVWVQGVFRERLDSPNAEASYPFR